MGRFDFLLEILFNPQLIILEELQPLNVLASLIIAAFCGLVIFVVYRFFNKSVLYSANFNFLIVMVCVITAFVIITIGANIVLTLGMVGALSIVRFRAAVKDPLDVGFLFWGVAAGLTAGARLHLVAIIGTAFIAVLYIVLTNIRIDKRAFLLIVRFGVSAEDAVMAQLKSINYKLKNKTVSNDYIEITAEVKVRQNDSSFTNPLHEIHDVENVMLVEYTGDYS